MINVVCVKTGDVYSAEYVNKLASMVSRHLTMEHKFWCITDNPYGIDKHIGIKPSTVGFTGWWSKLQVFRRGLFEGDYILYLDLDTLIVDNLEYLIAYGEQCLEEDALVLLEDFNRPCGYGSAVFMLSTNGVLHYVLDRFLETPEQYVKGYHGDQEFLESCVKSVSIWPHDWVVPYPGALHPSYHSHDMSSGVDDRAKVVCFHGPPKNHEVINDPLVEEHWR